MSDPLWFYWPITFATAASIAVGRLIRGPGGLGLAAVAGVSVFLPVVPLWLGLSVTCDDGTHFLDFNAIALGVGAGAVVVWLYIVSRLYGLAGQSRPEIDRSVLTMFAGILVGLGVEFLASTISVETYCGRSTTGMLVQLVVAALVSIAAGVTWSRLVRQVIL